MTEPREEEEREHEVESDATQTTATTKSGKSQKKRGRKKKEKKSLDELNDRISKQEERFTSFESKMDQLLFALGSPGGRPSYETLHGGTLGAPRTFDDDNRAGSERDSPVSGDRISVLVANSERRRTSFMNSETDSRYPGEHESVCSVQSADGDRFGKYHGKTVQDSNQNLVDIFGVDAQASKSKTNDGLRLDESQKNILSESWHCSNPQKLTSYRESYRTSFPVEEESAALLQVPKLDDSVESLLVKKYGHKGAFGSAPSLYGSKFRSLEKVGYQGQMAARMGIVLLCYSQKALGSLLENLQSETPNIDKAIQTTRDIFAMSTKSLDQVAKSGAYHHVSRRKSAVYDTGLDEYKDYASAVMSLPLTNEGVFGKQFDEKLKARQERFKQISEVLPEFDNSNKHSTSVSNKRKASSSGYSDQSKRRRSSYGRGGQYSSSSRPYQRSNWSRGRSSRGGRSATVSSFRDKSNN